MSAANYVEFLDLVDRGAADLPGLLADLGDAVLGVRIDDDGLKIDFDHRRLRNTSAHGYACRRGFIGAVNYRLTAAPICETI